MTLPTESVVPAVAEAVEVAEEMAAAEDMDPSKNVLVISVGEVRQNVKEMVVPAVKEAMEVEADQEKDTVGLEVLGTKWVEMITKKVVKAVKAEVVVEEEMAEQEAAEVKEATSVVMVLMEEADKRAKTVGSKKAGVVSEATAMEDLGKVVEAVVVSVTLPLVTVEDLHSLNLW